MSQLTFYRISLQKIIKTKEYSLTVLDHMAEMSMAVPALPYCHRFGGSGAAAVNF
jgi:hypothetical protein